MAEFSHKQAELYLLRSWLLLYAQPEPSFSILISSNLIVLLIGLQSCARGCREACASQCLSFPSLFISMCILLSCIRRGWCKRRTLVALLYVGKHHVSLRKKTWTLCICTCAWRKKTSEVWITPGRERQKDVKMRCWFSFILSQAE